MIYLVIDWFKAWKVAKCVFGVWTTKRMLQACGVHGPCTSYSACRQYYRILQSGDLLPLGASRMFI